ncbi:paramyosin-like isoform X1 [Syngnathus typhle]|uniref:paramyosin-like isoform X1 n=1 Tax=Syngnathus typhle TaxID=161592 RepID=UPI002A6A7F82|nr:paramyosin-like isoform X1 [Syngnathus typhle]
MRLRASESALDQLKRKSSVLASRLCLVENLRKRSSVADTEVQVHQNSSQGHTSALISERDGQRQETKSRVETDSSNIHQNMSAFHARLLHLEGKMMTGEQHLHNIRAAIVNTLNDTETQKERLEVQMNVVKNHVEDMWTEISVKSGQLSNMEAQLGNACNNTAALEGNVKMAEAHVEKLKVLSSALEVRLNVSERLLEELKTECTALDRRLNVSDKFQEQLKTESRAQTTRVSNVESRLTNSIHNTAAVEVRLNISEKILEELKTECTAWTTHLSNVEFQLTHNIDNTEVLLRRLNMNGQKINNLKETTKDLMSRLHVLEQHGTQTSGETKVAFAAALTDSGSVGPFDQETTLIFSKVFTNIGRAYDETSGVFTAPVDAIYVFSFTAADFLKGYMGVTLYRNQQPIVSSLDLNDHGGYASATNGALIPLEAGDRVRLSLPASYRLYDDTRSFSVFSGFLLFQVEADQ